MTGTEQRRRREPGRWIPGIGSAALLCALVLSADPPSPAAGEGGGAWERIDAASMTGAQKAKQAEAQSARDALASGLQRRLRSALEEGGPSSGIEACRKAAPEIAREVAAERHVKIGRTSFRLRNPENGPPGWAAALVERREEETAYLAGPEGEFGALFPIRVAPACVSCHGPGDEIPPAVRETLARLYPEDRATGFRQGDLRGWFWVEVP